ncbi:MAG: U32 family peptidase C-terminal domain-containing protein, partial [Bdellovibrionota bacterium]
VSIREAGAIKRATGLEVELFVHGSMCMAYSGNCTISNFTQGRDSNRGGCAQSCRFSYSLTYPNDTTAVSNRFFMSSKDLMGLDLLPEFLSEGIDSIKIEGRMRSPLYAGVISKIYREALDALGPLNGSGGNDSARWKSEVELLPHREYMTASLTKPADHGSTLDKGIADSREHYDFVGLVRKAEVGSYLLIEVKSPFAASDELEILPFQGSPLIIRAEHLKSSVGLPMTQAKVSALARIPFVAGAEVGNIVRRVVR